MWGNALKIILVETTHPGNIGASARAMKNMGLQRLILVNPKAQFPCVEATARAAGADSILEQVEIVDTLAQAVADCGFVIGTSAQTRGLPLASIDAEQGAIETCHALSKGEQAAIVFGTERSGLTNDHLQYCHRQLVIPTNSDYSSLNLAQAVQIVSYELRKQALTQNLLASTKSVASKRPNARLATIEELNYFYRHLEETLIDINFIDVNVEKKILPRLKRLFNRSKLELNELNLLHGILSAAFDDNIN